MFKTVAMCASGAGQLAGRIIHRGARLLAAIARREARQGFKGWRDAEHAAHSEPCSYLQARRGSAIIRFTRSGFIR